MNPSATRFSPLLSAIILVWGLSSAEVRASFDEEVQETVRLSNWLAARISRPGNTDPYLPGLVWAVPEERVVQARARNDLLVRLQDRALSPNVAKGTLDELTSLVERLPATGRVVLDNADPRWLEVHPDKDPVLQPGHRVMLRERPHTVAVVFGNGRVCHVLHDAARYAVDYIKRCDGSAAPRRAWLVQPDGIVQRRGVALWNEESQDAPAPGAWVVVEEKRYPWHPVIYEQLARLLATQGPAMPAKNEPVGSLPVDKPGLLGGWQKGGRPNDLAVTASDWGTIGLMQMPSARMAPAGEGGIGFSRTKPYSRLNFSLQPFDWLEANFRYIDISNRAYEASSTGQSNKDKSIDIKVRLAKEGDLMPQVALGIRDLTGTGLFSGEYLVASKRTGNFDWTLGIGWGYLGNRGDLGNPLSYLDGSFKKRPTTTESAGTGGEVNLSTFFHGPAALFGGVQYQTPWEDLILKLEYDGNDYQHEPQSNNQKQASPLNLGAVWRYSDNLDFSLGWERGNTLTFGANFHGQLDQLRVPKIHDPKPVPVARQYPKRDPDWKKLAAALEETTGWRVRQLARAGSELLVRFDEIDAFYWHDFMDRIAALLHRDVPGTVLVFRIQSVNAGLEVSEYLVDRLAWVDAKTRYLAPHEKRSPVMLASYSPGFVNPYDETLLDRPAKRFSGDYGIYYQQSFGGPDAFVLYQLGGRLSGTWQPRPDTWLTGVVRGALVDNYDIFKADGPSKLQRVRTDVRKYVTTSEITLPVLQLTHVGKLDRNQYYSVYGGLLESMYGGVGGEWLYRPFDSRLAIGVDLNLVRQRGFAQDFSFRDYQTTTGHVSLYWDTGIQDIQATIQAGRYLAGDTGVTVDLSRVFSNGVKMGAWFTKTNVSAADFGEGSFDKGIYLDVPFDAMMTRSSGSVANLVWQPLLRDGGARLMRQVTLADLTRGARGDALRWQPFRKERDSQFGDVGDQLGDPIKIVSPYAAAWQDLSLLGSGLGEAGFWQNLLLAGGITAVSSLLDKPADSLAKDYGDNPAMKAVEVAGNALPFAVLGYSALMALGDHDPRMANASFASLEAGGIGLVTALGLKYALGRARPEANQGAAKFNPFSSGNGDSGLPSVHSTVAWAALTPYAKAYNAPWLYGLAALTNVARIGERKHWLSDTVGGALLGYGLGSLFWESRKQSKNAPSIYVSAGEIGLEWQVP